MDQPKIPPEMNDNPRRLLLRVSVKLMVLLALAIAGYALLSSVGDGKDRHEAPAPLKVHIPSDTSPIFSRIRWVGGNLILLKRDSTATAALSRLDSELLDPESHNAKQPNGLNAARRSLSPGYFLAYDRGTDMGCPLSWVPPGNTDAPHQPWPGGFRDTCRGSWYDAAGRVFKGQQAGRNLDIPAYREIAPDLLEVGGNGDNPASEN